MAQTVAALDEYVGYGDVVALCGSLPRGVEPGFYGELIRRYQARGAFVALDADGEALRLGVAQKPNVIKPNREELGRWAGAPLTDDQAFQAAATRIASDTGGLCLATDGSRSALLAGAGPTLMLQPPRSAGSAVGAGDAALAGLLAGLVRGGDPARSAADPKVAAEAFRLAVACGAASASTPDTEMFTPELLAETLKRIGEPDAY